MPLPEIECMVLPPVDAQRIFTRAPRVWTLSVSGSMVGWGICITGVVVGRAVADAIALASGFLTKGFVDVAVVVLLPKIICDEEVAVVRVVVRGGWGIIAVADSLIARFPIKACTTTTAVAVIVVRKWSSVSSRSIVDILYVKALLR
jgi:hypothetical protein